MSSYVETDDDGNNDDDDEDDDDDDGAMFPGGAKFFVKMQSARKRGRYENRQKARQRSHTVDPGTGQDYLVFGALPSQIQLVPNEIKLPPSEHTRNNAETRVANPLSHPSPTAGPPTKRTRQGDAIFPEDVYFLS